jgi:hypothetical protein
MMALFNVAVNGIEVPGGINTVFDIKYDTGASGDRRIVKIIGTAKELNTFLPTVAGWGKKAEAKVDNPVSKRVVHEEIIKPTNVKPPRNGLYIILGRNRNHATLWDGARQDVFGETNNNYIFENYNQNLHQTRDNSEVYFWELKGSSKLYHENDGDVDLRIFTQKEFDLLKKLIDRNVSKIRAIRAARSFTKSDYGYGPDDIYDCVTLVHRGLQQLLSTRIRMTSGQMDEMMRNDFIKLGYAEDGIEIEFRDRSGNKTQGITNPTNYLNKTLSKTVVENIGSNTKSGYYVFGVSVMDGYHSVILIAKVVKGEDARFNIFDQQGSWIKRDENNMWYSAEDIDRRLINAVLDGHELRYGGKGQTTTILYPIKRRE